jgi:cell division protein FtsB
MSIFSRKLKSDEYESVLNKITEFKYQVSALAAEVEALRTNQNSLRGKVNQIAGGDKDKVIEDNEKDLNLPFPFNKAG